MLPTKTGRMYTKHVSFGFLCTDSEYDFLQLPLQYSLKGSVWKVVVAKSSQSPWQIRKRLQQLRCDTQNEEGPCHRRAQRTKNSPLLQDFAARRMASHATHRHCKQETMGAFNAIVAVCHAGSRSCEAAGVFARSRTEQQ